MSMKKRGRLAKARRGLGRRLVVVDIENIAGGALTSAAAVVWAKQTLRHAVHLERADHVVIGTSHVGLLTIGCAWPDQRYVVRSGPNGADLALLEVLGENLPARFGRVVVASGMESLPMRLRASGGRGCMSLSFPTQPASRVAYGLRLLR